MKTECLPKHMIWLPVEHTKLDITEEDKVFLDEINDFNIETRYPEYKQEFYRRCTKEFTDRYFIKINEYYTWLISQLI